jgi:hypothetical protein
MSVVRLLSVSMLLLVVSFYYGSLSQAQAPGIDPTRLPEFRKTTAILELKENRSILQQRLEESRKLFQELAAYEAQMIAHPLVYRLMRDPLAKTDAVGRQVPTIDMIFRDLERFLVYPAPGSQVTSEHADYIRELGNALDVALRPLISSHPERIVRVNATRMLALVCRMGATVHYATVTELISSPNVPPEIKNYALQAAANLLSAYDVTDYKSRRHSNGWRNDVKPGSADLELAALVAAIEKCITDPNSLIPGLWNGDAAKPAILQNDQVPVAQFIRRQAIRAMAQVRFVALQGVGPDGKGQLYPAYCLARVCLSDPRLLLPSSPADCAEAIIGLCNMAPRREDGKPIKEYNAAAAVEAITAGLITFAEPRGDPTDTSLHWRTYGLRLTEALNNWRYLFDPLFDPTRPRLFDDKTVPSIVNDLIQRARVAILEPLERVGPDGKPDPLSGRVQIDALRQYLQQLRANPKRNPLLFTNNPTTALPAPAMRN